MKPRKENPIPEIQFPPHTEVPKKRNEAELLESIRLKRSKQEPLDDEELALVQSEIAEDKEDLNRMYSYGEVKRKRRPN